MGTPESVVDLARGFIRVLEPYVGKLPRDKKFTYGGRLLERAIDVLEYTTTAYYSPRGVKADLVRKANIQVEVVRQLLRAMHENGLHDLRKHEHFARELDSVGRALGAWLKSLNAPTPHS